MSNDKDKEVWKKCEAAIEIFDNMLKKNREMVETIFGKPASYYDTEKQRIIDLSTWMFEMVVTSDDIQAMAEKRTEPTILIPVSEPVKTEETNESQEGPL